MQPVFLKSQDFYGMGGRTARWSLNLIIGRWTQFAHGAGLSMRLSVLFFKFLGFISYWYQIEFTQVVCSAVLSSMQTWHFWRWFSHSHKAKPLNHSESRCVASCGFGHPDPVSHSKGRLWLFDCLGLSFPCFFFPFRFWILLPPVSEPAQWDLHRGSFWDTERRFGRRILGWVNVATAAARLEFARALFHTFSGYVWALWALFVPSWATVLAAPAKIKI